MAKCIVIENCKDCPYLDHSGGFGYPRYIPICGKSKNRKLPHKTVSGLENAQASYTIPAWCELNNFPEN